jgi:hypothetical protein
MVQKVTLSTINIKAFNKNNMPFITKAGKPFKRIEINDATQNKWYSFMDYEDNAKDWKVGDVMDFDVIERTFNGKVYYDLRLPGAHRSDWKETLDKRFEALEKDVADVKAQLQAIVVTMPEETKEEEK